MSPVTWRRFGASVAALAVAASLATVSSPAQAATPSALADGSSWLTSQLTGGLVHNPNYGGFDDYGLSADIALALNAVGGNATAVGQIVDALHDNESNYTTNAAYGYPDDIYAGSTAKALVLSQLAGGTGDASLVSQLEARVSATAPIAGRIEDGIDASDPYGADYANVIGQAYAVAGLEKAGSAEAGDALSFLLEQQCSEGYFRLSFTADKTAADQTCDGGIATGASPADPDVTSTAILELLPLADDNDDIADALAKAKDWLSARQHADGSFSGGTSTDSPNANSTGLAGWALGELGDTDAAAAAAQWIRIHQVQPLNGCATKLDGDAGAIAYDTAALTAGRKTGITDAVQDQWRRAASQALPVLQWLPASAKTPKLTAPTGYVKAGSKVTVRATGGVSGSALCLGVGSRRNLVTAGADGSAQTVVTLPGGTANRAASLTDGTTTRTATVKVLGKKTFKVKASKRVKRGKKATVKVSGLAPHERFTLRVGKKVVKHGTARANGTFKTKVKVGKKVHKVKIKVTGQFGKIRKGAWTVKVVR